MNKIEEYKREKDGLDILDDIPRYAAEGWEKITDADKELMKWAGVFFRRQTPGRFMMRLRFANGFLSATQLRTIGEISVTSAKASRILPHASKCSCVSSRSTTCRKYGNACAPSS